MSRDVMYSTANNYHPDCKGYEMSPIKFKTHSTYIDDYVSNGSWDNTIKAKEKCYV